MKIISRIKIRLIAQFTKTIVYCKGVPRVSISKVRHYSLNNPRMYNAYNYPLKSLRKSGIYVLYMSGCVNIRIYTYYANKPASDCIFSGILRTGVIRCIFMKFLLFLTWTRIINLGLCFVTSLTDSLMIIKS